LQRANQQPGTAVHQHVNRGQATITYLLRLHPSPAKAYSTGVVFKAYTIYFYSLIS